MKKTQTMRSLALPILDLFRLFDIRAAGFLLVPRSLLPAPATGGSEKIYGGIRRNLSSTADKLRS